MVLRLLSKSATIASEVNCIPNLLQELYLPQAATLFPHLCHASQQPCPTLLQPLTLNCTPDPHISTGIHPWYHYTGPAVMGAIVQSPLCEDTNLLSAQELYPLER